MEYLKHYYFVENEVSKTYSLWLRKVVEVVYFSDMWHPKDIFVDSHVNSIMDRWTDNLELGLLVSLTWLSFVDKDSIRKGLLSFPLLGFALAFGLTSGVYCLLCNLLSFIIKCIIA